MSKKLPQKQSHKKPVIINKESDSHKGQPTIYTEHYQGVVPHPNIMRGYAEIDPEFPNKIMQWSEDNLIHDRKMESKSMMLIFWERLFNNFFGFSVAALFSFVGYCFMAEGHPNAGATIICTTVISGIGLFVTKKYQPPAPQ